MDDRCVICGAVIPEGRQVCPKCEYGRKFMPELLERVENSTNFLRSVYYQVNQMEDRTFLMDAETIKILFILLKDVKTYLES